MSTEKTGGGCAELDPTADPTCGCCEGVATLTPLDRRNRPGLDALVYRAGTHPTFLASMLARLSSLRLDDGSDPLRRLTTRSTDDPSIALLDAWAVVGDILTFYQERIANEGFLRTAGERRSLLELARLVGYRPRPGLSASVYLAFTLEQDAELEVPAGTRAQSVPVAKDELPQFFESEEDLPARFAWNALRPRLTLPHALENLTVDQRAYLGGVTTGLKVNDPVLVDHPAVATAQSLFRVRRIETEVDADRTRVALAPWRAAGSAPPAAPEPPASERAAGRVRQAIERFGDLESFDITRGATAKRVLARLEALGRAASEPVSGDELLGELEETVSLLRGERAEAEARGFNRLRPWMSEIIGTLDETGELLRGRLGLQSDSLLARLIGELSLPPSTPPANALRLRPSLERSFGRQAASTIRLATAFRPAIADTIYTAWAAAPVTLPAPIEEVHGLRVRALPFGAAAPLKVVQDDDTGVILDWVDWPLDDGNAFFRNDAFATRILPLDAVYDEIRPQSRVVIDRRGHDLVVATVVDTRTVVKTAFGTSAKVTELTLDRDWFTPTGSELSLLSPIREIGVLAGAEALALATRPLSTPVCGGTIELDGLYPGLEPGRWLIVSGERVIGGSCPEEGSTSGFATSPPRGSLEEIEGVRVAELVMLAGVRHLPHQVPIFTEAGPQTEDLAGDTNHTVLELAEPLAWVYRRDTVTIHGNVVKATHGETREQILGSGDGGRANQSFPLAFVPLTHLAAPTARGSESTLEVRVNRIAWDEVRHPASLGPDDRAFFTRTDDDEVTTATFGDGRHGTRLPTGVDNVTATYRQGIGRPGNVDAEQISLLATQPLGVKGVINPIAASGGADRDDAEAIRRNAPLAVTALDRLVSVQDYADFARTFAGIAKARSVRLTDGRRSVVHLTVAGVDDIEIREDSDLFRALEEALRAFGDPHQPFMVAPRRLQLLLISAGVRVDDDHRWEDVAPAIRARLADALGFDRRDLAQDVTASEVTSLIQAVPGVVWVDLDVLFGLPEEQILHVAEFAGKLAERARPFTRVRADVAQTRAGAPIRPAELVYLDPDLPETLLLEERQP